METTTTTTWICSPSRGGFGAYHSVLARLRGSGGKARESEI